eukprot:gene14399-biopygen613
MQRMPKDAAECGATVEHAEDHGRDRGCRRCGRPCKVWKASHGHGRQRKTVEGAEATEAVGDAEDAKGRG